jgi:hypothetical protein
MMTNGNETPPLLGSLLGQLSSESMDSSIGTITKVVMTLVESAEADPTGAFVPVVLWSVIHTIARGLIDECGMEKGIPHILVLSALLSEAITQAIVIADGEEPILGDNAIKDLVRGLGIDLSSPNNN